MHDEIKPKAPPPPVVFDNTPTVVVVRVPVNRNGKIGLLMIRRALKDGFGKLALPGGWQVRPHSVRETGAKEVEEETGLIVDPAELRVADIDTTPSGVQNLVFFDAPTVTFDGEFTHDAEVSEVTVIYDPVETAFPMHTKMVKDWFDKQANLCTLTMIGDEITLPGRMHVKTKN